jgi:hypothetical protein
MPKPADLSVTGFDGATFSPHLHVSGCSDQGGGVVEVPASVKEEGRCGTYAGGVHGQPAEPDPVNDARLTKICYSRARVPTY